MFELDQARLPIAIDSFYEAALAPELWPSALDTLSAAAGGIGALMLYMPHTGTAWSAHTPSLNASVQAFFDEGWHAQNSRVPRGLQAVAAGHSVFSDEMLFRPGELDREPIQIGLFDRYGLRSFAGFELVPAGVAGAIERGKHPFQEWELEAIRRALPHLSRASAFSLVRGNAHSDGVLDALSLLNCAAVLVDYRGCVLRMNAAAEPICRSSFKIEKQQLVPLHVGSRHAFTALINSAIAPARPNEIPVLFPVYVSRPARRPIWVQVMPIAGSIQDFFRFGKAVVLLKDPDLQAVSAAAEFQRNFNLTDAESRVAEYLSQGLSLNAIGLELGIAITTVRTHLQSIYSKTDTRRQGELIALLNRIPARPTP
jgi:DNA-binding CsgD family transcriptional regulator